MRIGITGNYGNQNQGDEAILEGIIIQLEQTYPVEREDICVFTKTPEETRHKLGVMTHPLYERTKTAPGSLMATIRQTMPVIRGLDMLIIGGGGILMDLYINSTVIFAMYGWLARRAHVPAVIYGAGAGPINTRAGKWLVKSLAGHADLVTVRDAPSKNLLASIGVKQPVQVIADPAFYVPAPAQEYPADSRLAIGVTALPYFHSSYWPEEDTQKYNHYIEGMAANLDHLLAEQDQAVITFFATKYPQDLGAVRDIQALMQYQDRTETQEDFLTHRELLALIEKQDLIIGTRLHSLILALAAAKPVMAVAYHQKVHAMMDRIDCAEASIHIENVHINQHFFADGCSRMAADWETTRTRFRERSEAMKYQEPRGMTLIQENITGASRMRKQGS
ncbi:polysaccharide pyruvyl transferase CsaB [Barrientosiimonas marina]|uniref:Polysaccharide pyruvyl transferase family protein n=1 Tax=Lentibacillus kimchii TaxID=1542911 RepID=A0ABW2UYX8_9BACI